MISTVGRSTNISWHECPVGKVERQKLLGQKGCVVWITGLSGSGLLGLNELSLFSSPFFFSGNFCKNFVIDILLVIVDDRFNTEGRLKPMRSSLSALSLCLSSSSLFTLPCLPLLSRFFSLLPSSLSPSC